MRLFVTGIQKAIAFRQAFYLFSLILNIALFWGKLQIQKFALCSKLFIAESTRVNKINNQERVMRSLEETQHVEQSIELIHPY